MKYFGKNLEFIDGTNGDSRELFEAWDKIGWCGSVTNNNANYLYCRYPALGNKCRLKQQKSFSKFLRLTDGS